MDWIDVARTRPILSHLHHEMSSDTNRTHSIPEALNMRCYRPRSWADPQVVRRAGAQQCWGQPSLGQNLDMWHGT